jgi:hypothetical protein
MDESSRCGVPSVIKGKRRKEKVGQEWGKSAE